MLVGVAALLFLAFPACAICGLGVAERPPCTAELGALPTALRARGSGLIVRGVTVNRYWVKEREHQFASGTARSADARGKVGPAG